VIWVYPPLGMLILTMLGGIYTFSLFYAPIQDYYSIKDVAPLTLAFSLITLTYSVFIVPAGVFYDRVGPRLPLLLGALVIFLGYTLASQMRYFDWNTGKILYYTGLGVAVGLGIALVDAVPRPLVSKWFPDKTGTAVGIVAVGFGIGAAVMTPVISYLLSIASVFDTFVYVGVIYLIVILLCTIPMRDPRMERREEEVSLNLSETLKDRRFQILWLAFLLSSFSGLMVIGNAAPILKEGAKQTPELVSLISTFLIVTSIANASGRLIWGFLLDKIGVVSSMLANFVTTAVSAFALSKTFSTYLVFPLASVIYANYGGVLAIFPSATAILFGKKYAGRIYGAIFTAWGFSGLIAPYAGGLVRDVLQSYTVAFYLASLSALLATLLILLSRRFFR